MQRLRPEGSCFSIPSFIHSPSGCSLFQESTLIHFLLWPNIFNSSDSSRSNASHQPSQPQTTLHQPAISISTARWASALTDRTPSPNNQSSTSNLFNNNNSNTPTRRSTRVHHDMNSNNFNHSSTSDGASGTHSSSAGGNNHVALGMGNSGVGTGRVVDPNGIGMGLGRSFNGTGRTAGDGLL